MRGSPAYSWASRWRGKPAAGKRPRPPRRPDRQLEPPGPLEPPQTWTATSAACGAHHGSPDHCGFGSCCPSPRPMAGALQVRGAKPGLVPRTHGSQHTWTRGKAQRAAGRCGRSPGAEWVRSPFPTVAPETLRTILEELSGHSCDACWCSQSHRGGPRSWACLLSPP